jgi:feruloyl-CoA synthase
MSNGWTVRREGETVYVKSVEPLGAYPNSLAERLVHWAEAAPERTFIARRGRDGAWVRVSFGEALKQARAIGAALLTRNLSAERPVAILAGNGVEHALLALGCLYVGLPWCPISPAYSQSQGDLSKLRFVFDLMTPGLVFVDDAAAFSRALELVPEGVETVAVSPSDGRKATAFADLLATDDVALADAAFAAVGPDTIAKFLLTSGSTGSPKAVVNTHRMLCANQQMILQSVPQLGEAPPVMVDWLPWNHTFGGNKVVGIALFHGGTLYIDDGRPVPGKLEATLANLREISPTVYFNVPAGFETMLPHLEADRALRQSLFARCALMFFGGAGLAADTAARLEVLATETAGRPVHMHSGLGSTETAPSALWLQPDLKPGSDVGLPMPGVELKLQPVGDKVEARLKGPSVTPGYWRSPKLTAAAFDDEGFYCLGDALRFVDPEQPHRGLVFDGRTAEDFKLSTGTWVSAGPLRTKLLAALKPLAADVVIAGLNRKDVRALVFPNFAALRALAGDLSEGDLVEDTAVHKAFAERLRRFGADAGSSGRVSALMLLVTPPTVDAGELTDKGSISQRGVLAARVADVERLYAAPSLNVVTTGQLFSPGHNDTARNSHKVDHNRMSCAELEPALKSIYPDTSNAKPASVLRPAR